MRIDCMDLEGSSEPRFAISLPIAGPDISPRELIRARVEIEAELHDGFPAMRQLVHPRPGAQQYSQNWPSEQLAPDLDAEAMVEIALQGFERGAFLLLVNHRQASLLDERLPLGETGEVIFLRLFPLKGG